MFDPFEMDFSNEVDIPACFEALSTIVVSDHTKVIKTRLHWWPRPMELQATLCSSACLDAIVVHIVSFPLCAMPTFFGASSFL